MARFISRIPHWLRLSLGGAAATVAIALLYTASRPSTPPSRWAEPEAALLSPAEQPFSEPFDAQQLHQRWVVSAHQARQLIAAGATLLDTRGEQIWARGHLFGSIPIDWRDFSRPESPEQGKLLADDRALTEKLQAMGISNDRPVVVVGDAAQGWGEDGRIVWMLRTLGHHQTVWVNGGYSALLQTGLQPVRSQPSVSAGDFIIQRTDRWSIERDELRQRLLRRQIVVIDTREAREYDGATPYGESRGGHIPGAVHLYYRDLLDQDGALLPKPEILQRLKQAGVADDALIVAYCTGGIRSAWVTTVLADVGLSVENYAGSMWEWAASSADRYPLQGQ